MNGWNLKLQKENFKSQPLNKKKKRKGKKMLWEGGG